MERIAVDAYLLDVLMPDLVGHDRRPSAFIVFLLLWRRTDGGDRTVGLSHRMIAEGTGLSRRAVQLALSELTRRQLIAIKRSTPTSIPMLTLRCPWRRRSSHA